MALAKSGIPTGEQPSIRLETSVDPHASRMKTVTGAKLLRLQHVIMLFAIVSACSKVSCGRELNDVVVVGVVVVVVSMGEYWLSSCGLVRESK